MRQMSETEYKLRIRVRGVSKLLVSGYLSGVGFACGLASIAGLVYWVVFA